MGYTVPNTFATQSGNVPASQLDANNTALLAGINNAYLFGLAAARPAAGSAGAYYFATDTRVLYLDNGTTWTQVTFPLSTSLRGYLAGCTLSNDGGTPLTVLDVSQGVVCADDHATIISLSAITGSIGGTWVVGTGNGKLDVGVIAATTWYHVFAILRTDTNVSDILFSLSPSAPTMPANYTQKRRIGSFKTDGGSHILPFVQDGDYFRWAASILDSGVSTTNPGTAAITPTLVSVPTGVSVMAMMNFVIQQGGAVAQTVYISDLAANDEAPIAYNAAPAVPGYTFSNQGVSGSNAGGMVTVRTNTSAQFRYRMSSSDANTKPFAAVLGWYDTRGRFA